MQIVQWRKLDQFPEEIDEAYHLDDELNVDYRLKSIIMSFNIKASVA